MAVYNPFKKELKTFEISCDNLNVVAYTKAYFPSVWKYYEDNHKITTFIDDLAAAYEKTGIKLVYHELTNYSQVQNGRRIGWSSFLYKDEPKVTEETILGKTAVVIEEDPKERAEKETRLKKVRETLGRIQEQYPYLEVDTEADYIPYSFKVKDEYRERRMLECAGLYPEDTTVDVKRYSEFKDFITKLEAAQAAMAEACLTEVKYRDLKIA